MTPIEAAIKAADVRGWHTSYGLKQFGPDDARAIITAFLDAAMANQTACGLVGDSINQTWRGGKIAIRALKEVL